MRAFLPDPSFFLNKPVPGRSDLTIVELVATGNDGQLFKAFSQELGRHVACKLIPSKNLQHAPDGKPLWRDEIHKANVLRNSTVVKVDHVCDWPGVPISTKTNETSTDNCVALISELIDGKSLKEFISQRSDDVTIPLIVNWLESMLNLLHEMKQRTVSHGDLHAGNILVEDHSTYDLLSPRFVFRVTDFGVGDSTSEPRFKDDFLQIASVLADMLRLLDYEALSSKDKFTFHVLRDHFVGRHLVESDQTLDPIAKQPDQLFQKLRRIDQDYERTVSSEVADLVTPFDFLSCEQIGESSDLLHALYSDRFLGLSEIEGRNNLVVTGPRGCGKSTVFRNLSLEQRMRVNDIATEELRYLGIYYRCDDLYFSFPRYSTPLRSEGLDLPLHFITSTLAARLLSSVEKWSRSYFRDDFSKLEKEAAIQIWEAIKEAPPNAPNYGTFKALVARLDKERTKSVEHQRFVNDIKRPLFPCYGPDILQNICASLCKSFPFIRDRPIYFFIDDYSSPKVTKDLQASLNRIFMQRTSVCFFKLSTESPVSFSKNDIDGTIYVENREFTLLNLGLVYLHADIAPKLSFVEDVFQRRLTKASNSFPAKTLQELVGTDSKQNNNEMARKIRSGEKPALWGKEILSRLCSGDIHYLISLVSDMVTLAGGVSSLGTAGATKIVPPDTQNRAIREAAGRFLKNLKGVPRCGDELVAIVEAFGTIAHSHLKFLDSKNESGSPPKQASRIEPYEPCTFSEPAQKLYDELLRYSVFIEDFRGKSRRGRVVPRLYLRRFLIPHFNLTFSIRDSIELEPKDFESFLLHPKLLDQKFRLKSQEDANNAEREEDKNQLPLLLKDV